MSHPTVRVDRWHRYYADDQRIPSVTSIISQALGSPPLAKWASGLVADFAVQNWDELSALPLDERRRWLADEAMARNRSAIVRGQDVHKAGEAIVAGLSVATRDEVRPYAEAYARLCDRFDVTPVYSEKIVYRLDPHVLYAGRFDLVADLRGLGRWLIDLKTGKGVYPQVGLQLAAYRFAHELVLDPATSVPMIPVDHCGVMHIREDGADLYPILADDDAFRAFLYAAHVAKWLDRDPYNREKDDKARKPTDIIGEILEPPEINPGQAGLTERIAE